MKNISILCLGLVLLFSSPAAAYDLPEFNNATYSKIMMPGGIYYGMREYDAIALLKKRNPSLKRIKNWVGYESTKNGIKETYGVRFRCNRVYFIHYSILGPDPVEFYENLSPLKNFIDNLRPHYFGPVYGEYIIRVKLVDDENLRLEIWNDSLGDKAQLMIELYWGERDEEPECAFWERK